METSDPRCIFSQMWYESYIWYNMSLSSIEVENSLKLILGDCSKQSPGSGTSYDIVDLLTTPEVNFDYCSPLRFPSCLISD